MNIKRYLPGAWMIAGAVLASVVTRLIPSVQAQQQATPAASLTSTRQTDRGSSDGGIAVVTRGGGGVYIVRGNTVYLLDARSLKVLRQTELPPAGTKSLEDDKQ